MSRIWLIAMGFVLATCQSARHIEIELDKSDSRRILAYYFGGYADTDPYSAGLLLQRGGRYYLDPNRLEDVQPGMVMRLKPFLHGRWLRWDSLAAFVQATYYESRKLPVTLNALKASWPRESAEHFEVHGPMTRYLRRIHVPNTALREALERYSANGGRLIYPPGTAIWAEHVHSDAVMETTAMIRRADGYWDFATYDSTGVLSVSTKPNPRALLTPTQCVGCHFGIKQFEPERSFPQDAPDAPDGLRVWYTSEHDGVVVRYFEEHFRRSDTVLGLYNSIFVSGLRAARDTGTISEADARLLADLGL